MKPAHLLTPSDFAKHRVWEFADDFEAELPDETFMQPVEQAPVKSLSRRLVGAQLTLASGQQLFGVLGNVDVDDPISTQHFLTVTVFNSSGDRFDLARYHDADYTRRDAASLGAFLGMSVPSIFPMQYDLRDIAEGQLACLTGTIPSTPPIRLSHDELIRLAVK